MPITVSELAAELPRDVNAALSALIARVAKIPPADRNDVRVAVIVLRKFIAKARLSIAIPDEEEEEEWDRQLSILLRNSKVYLDDCKTDEIESAAEQEIDNWVEGLDDEPFGCADLGSAEKQSIFVHLERIRQLIEDSELSQKKKRALFDKLTKLYNEVLKNTTKTDEFFAFMGDLAFVIGDMANKAQPAIKEFKEVLRIVMNGRAKKEGVNLPKPSELPQLPAPDQSDGD